MFIKSGHFITFVQCKFRMIIFDYTYGVWMYVDVYAYRQAFLRVDLNHATEESLTIWRNEVRHVKHSTLHLLQQLTQVIVVKG